MVRSLKLKRVLLEVDFWGTPQLADVRLEIYRSDNTVVATRQSMPFTELLRMGEAETVKFLLESVKVAITNFYGEKED